MALILIVEDNELNADMLSRRVGRLGHRVVVGVDGKAGLDLTVQLLPDLVIMDMSLPVMDGWEATRQIKADGRISHIPVLALTAHAIVGDRNKALLAGCDEYETKPIDWERLRGKIGSLLAGEPSAKSSPEGKLS